MCEFTTFFKNRFFSNTVRKPDGIEWHCTFKGTVPWDFFFFSVFFLSKLYRNVFLFSKDTYPKFKVCIKMVCLFINHILVSGHIVFDYEDLILCEPVLYLTSMRIHIFANIVKSQNRKISQTAQTFHKGLRRSQMCFCSWKWTFRLKSWNSETDRFKNEINFAGNFWSIFVQSSQLIFIVFKWARTGI